MSDELPLRYLSRQKATGAEFGGLGDAGVAVEGFVQAEVARSLVAATGYVFLAFFGGRAPTVASDVATHSLAWAGVHPTGRVT